MGRVPAPVPVISVQQLEERLRLDPHAFVLDVREPWEFGRGHVPDARLIPLGELERRVNEIPRDRPVFAICQTGQRSEAAAGYLLRLGYRQVANVEGGTAAWIKRGFPIDR